MMRRPNVVSADEISGLRRRLGRSIRSVLLEFRWRRNNITTFEYLITEVLLQQTRADMGARFAGGFFQRFHGWTDILSTGVDDLADALQPLGLHRQRAERLMRLAAAFSKAGVVPVSYAELIRQPGVGQYAASTIAVRFGEEHQPMLDTNMARLLGDSGEVERSFRKEAERHSGMIPNTIGA